ncbi:MAG: penicillin-binding protein 2 [Armatimonadota bacterium]
MFTYRLIILRYVVVAAFVIFLGRLGYLQLINGLELRAKSEQNYQRWVRQPAPRGVILDRKGRILVTNASVMSAWLVSGEVPRKGWDELLQQLVTLGIYPDRATATDELDECRRFPNYLPVRLKSQLTIAEVTRVSEMAAFLPGVYLKSEPVRNYPYGSLAAHLVGYLREIDDKELDARRDQGYRLGDNIGKTGLERAYEDQLRGVEGGDEIEIDVRGHVLRTLNSLPAQAGQTLTLTVDMDVQREAEAALGGRQGAAVVLDPATGDIRALVSTPGYDLNQMSGHLSPAAMKVLVQNGAFVNRATLGQYPPGSVFKIVTAATALEAGKVPEDKYFYCEGIYHGIHCWKHSGHGALDLTGAIAQSCNVAFMKMAEASSIASLVKMGRRFGLGKATGLKGVPEADGLMPDPEWARKAYNRAWEPGETLQVGIGQSYTQVTPLQAARVVAAIANGGKLVHPRMVTAVGKDQQPFAEPTLIGLKPETLSRIVRGLRAVASEGTAKSLDPTLHIAGKTGTAQNPSGADHAWFVGYAPADNPKVAIVVLVVHGGHGGATAAPIAEAIIRTALHGPPSTANAQQPTINH